MLVLVLRKAMRCTKQEAAGKTMPARRSKGLLASTTSQLGNLRPLHD